MFENIFKFIRNTFPEGDFYIVGGATRDFLLNKFTKDIDIATSLTPNEIKKYLIDADYRFEKTGIVSYKLDNYHLTFATLRKESDYIDFRHPKTITFITSYVEDSKRRDFTINAIYFTPDGSILDPQGGINDINDKILRTIGNPLIRLKEDPLRIIRGLRFAYSNNFIIEKNLEKAIYKSLPYLKYLSKGKIVEELSKCDEITKKKILDIIQLSNDN